MTKTIRRLRIAHHRIKIEEVKIPGKMYGRKRDYLGYCYMITGGLWNWGSFHSEGWTAKECLAAAIKKVREDHPRAKAIIYAKKGDEILWLKKVTA